VLEQIVLPMTSRMKGMKELSMPGAVQGAPTPARAFHPQGALCLLDLLIKKFFETFRRFDLLFPVQNDVDQPPKIIVGDVPNPASLGPVEYCRELAVRIEKLQVQTRAGEPFMLNECDGLPSYTRSEKPTCRKPASLWNSGVSMIRTANGLSTLTSADEPCGQGSRRLTWVEMIGVVTPLLGETAMLVSFT